jgi:hypothetical protein
MKKSKAAQALAKKKAMAGEKKEGKLTPAQDKKHEKSESKKYESMESGGETTENASHRMPNGKTMKGKMY